MVSYRYIGTTASSIDFNSSCDLQSIKQTSSRDFVLFKIRSCLYALYESFTRLYFILYHAQLLLQYFCVVFKNILNC